jgi:hypothetical protein
MGHEFISLQTHTHTHTHTQVSGRWASWGNWVIREVNITVQAKSTEHNLPGAFVFWLSLHSKFLNTSRTITAYFDAPCKIFLNHRNRFMYSIIFNTLSGGETVLIIFLFPIFLLVKYLLIFISPTYEWSVEFSGYPDWGFSVLFPQL